MCTKAYKAARAINRLPIKINWHYKQSEKNFHTNKEAILLTSSDVLGPIFDPNIETVR
jgi:hypothetical protein